MRLGLDYAGGRPGGRAIRDAGYTFAVRYLSEGGSALPGKLLTPAEAEDLRANGVSIAVVWETTANRMLGGRSAGIADASAARGQIERCGGPEDRPVYFAADWDATPAQQAQINAYLEGAASVVGLENTGIYGGYWPLSRAKQAGLASWFWQTEAWSGTNRLDGRQLHQRTGFVTVGGVQCDVDEALSDDFGQWDWEEGAELEAAAGFERLVIDQLRLIWEQLMGPGGKDWEQLGSKSLVDFLAGKWRTQDEINAAMADGMKILLEGKCDA